MHVFFREKSDWWVSWIGNLVPPPRRQWKIATIRLYSILFASTSHPRSSDSDQSICTPHLPAFWSICNFLFIHSWCFWFWYWLKQLSAKIAYVCNMISYATLCCFPLLLLPFIPHHTGDRWHSPLKFYGENLFSVNFFFLCLINIYDHDVVNDMAIDTVRRLWWMHVRIYKLCLEFYECKG